MVQAHIIVEGRVITTFSELDAWFFCARNEVHKIKDPGIRKKCMLQLFLYLQHYHAMLVEIIPYENTLQEVA